MKVQTDILWILSVSTGFIMAGMKKLLPAISWKRKMNAASPSATCGLWGPMLRRHLTYCIFFRSSQEDPEKRRSSWKDERAAVSSHRGFNLSWQNRWCCYNNYHGKDRKTWAQPQIYSKYEAAAGEETPSEAQTHFRFWLSQRKLKSLCC